MATTVHRVAQTGFGTGTNELYDRVRPSYQQFALDHIRAAVRNPGPWDIVEIGSGTGIFTRALLADPLWSESIKSLRALEPSEGMRDVFTNTVKDNRVSVADGQFTATGAEDSSADLIVIAQAFHWCPDFDQASREFARILKPGGVVALVWNLEDRDASKWVTRLRDTIEVFEQGTPQFRLMEWRKTFDTEGYQKEFEPPLEKTWTYTIPTTKELAADRALSKSYMAIQPPDVKAKTRTTIEGIIDREDKMWIDQDKGVFEYPYKTWVVVSLKK